MRDSFFTDFPLLEVDHVLCSQKNTSTQVSVIETPPVEIGKAVKKLSKLSIDATPRIFL